MTVVLEKSWHFRDYTDTDNNSELKWVKFDCGVYDIEKINNPLGHDGSWIVFKGTTVGGAELWWRQWDFIKINDHELKQSIQ